MMREYMEGAVVREQNLKRSKVLVVVLAAGLLAILFLACTNTAIQKTVTDINQTRLIESQVDKDFEGLDKDTSEWNTSYNSLTTGQNKIVTAQNSQQPASQADFDTVSASIKNMQDIVNENDLQLTKTAESVSKIETEREASSKKLEDLLKDSPSDWFTQFIDKSIELDKKKALYYRTRYNYYANDRDGGKLQIELAQGKMTQQQKSNGGDSNTYNAAANEWNALIAGLNPKIEANLAQQNKLKEEVSQLEQDIEKIINERTKISKENSVRAMIERNRDIFDLSD